MFQVYPIVFIMALGTGFCAYTVGRRAIAHENVVWSKNYKKTGIANQYDYKYPGYVPLCFDAALRLFCFHFSEM